MGSWLSARGPSGASGLTTWPSRVARFAACARPASVSYRQPRREHCLGLGVADLPPLDELLFGRFAIGRPIEQFEQVARPFGNQRKRAACPACSWTPRMPWFSGYSPWAVQRPGPSVRSSLPGLRISRVRRADIRAHTASWRANVKQPAIAIPMRLTASCRALPQTS